MDIKEVIDNKNKDIAKLQKEIKALEDAISLYPDLKRNVSRWNKIRYYTPKVNAIVDDCEIKASCGCCNDSPLYVWPFKNVSDFAIYSDPIKINVGEKNISGCDCGHNKEYIFYESWENALINKGISDIVIKKVRKFKDTYGQVGEAQNLRCVISNEDLSL